MHLADGREQWRVIASTVMKLIVPQKLENFLAS
jgi:hypothetical protein